MRLASPCHGSQTVIPCCLAESRVMGLLPGDTRYRKRDTSFLVLTYSKLISLFN